MPQAIEHFHHVQARAQAAPAAMVGETRLYLFMEVDVAAVIDQEEQRVADFTVTLAKMREQLARLGRAEFSPSR